MSIKFDPHTIKLQNNDFTNAYGHESLSYQEIEYDGSPAIDIKVLGNTVAVAEFPNGYQDANNAFTNLTWGADYTMFPLEVRRAYSLEEVENMVCYRHLGFYEYLSMIVNEICDQILTSGLRLARHTYYKTSRKHIDGSPIYELTHPQRPTAVIAETLAPCVDLRKVTITPGDMFIGWGVYIASFRKEHSVLSLNPDTTFEEAHGGIRKYGDNNYYGLPALEGRRTTGDNRVTVDGRGLYQDPSRGVVKVSPNTKLSSVTYVGGLPRAGEGTHLSEIQIIDQSPSFPSGMKITGYQNSSHSGYHPTYVNYAPCNTCDLNNEDEMCDDCYDYVHNKGGARPVPVPNDREDHRTPYVVIGPIGSENGTLTAALDDSGLVKVTRGCFEGTLAEFEEKVDTVHKSSESIFYREYLAAIELIKARFAGSFFSREALEAAHTEDPTEG